ncbi:MAG: seg [Candidatus Paceibacter sp.]|jgi:prepilin-type N-terminal cleavage/methylation domain-containing protein|nr:seg [Candidatus Paceibacter sp.]
MNKKSLQKNKGFTLLETLIAIAILSVAIGSAFTVAQKSLSSSYLAKNQTAAFFLASEGIELVRNIRDNVALYNINQGTTIDWLQPFKSRCSPTLIDNCIFDINPYSSASEFGVNGGSTPAGALNTPTKIRLSNQADCNNARGCRLKNNPLGGAYFYYASTDTLTTTIYYRKISIRELNVSGGTGKREAVVSVCVSWLEGNCSTGQNSFTIIETLSNWH